MTRNQLYAVLEEQYFGEGMHEKAEIAILPDLLKDVSLFIDVGASLGQYTYFASRAMKHGRIIAVEADPVRVERLEELASRWAKESNIEIRVLHAAAADTEVPIPFFVTNGNVSGGLFAHHNARADAVQWSKCKVPSITLDRVCEHVKPDLIKIDVEGAEFRVLQGATRILADGACRFLIELHPWGDEERGRTPADVLRLFAKFGYDFRRVHNHWLFERKGKSLMRSLKSSTAIFVLRHQRLKDMAKACIARIDTVNRRFFRS